jgi:16S rRNA G966 N2-methylase RsmD
MNEQKIYFDKLFPKFDGVNVQNLKIDHESVSYITVPSESKKISEIIINHIKKYKPINEATIVDATAGVGGDTIMLCQNFGSVISIELDPGRVECLNHNLTQYKLTNCITMNGNSCDIIPKLPYSDAIYFDVPWGGSDYKTKINLRLTLGDIPLEVLILNCFDSNITKSLPKIVISKLPTNYDLEHLYKMLSPNLDIYLYKLRKLNIIVIEKKL